MFYIIFFPSQPGFRRGEDRGGRLLLYTSSPAVLAGLEGRSRKTWFPASRAARLTSVLAVSAFLSRPDQYGFRRGEGPGEGGFIVYLSVRRPGGHSRLAARKTWFSLAPLRDSPPSCRSVPSSPSQINMGSGGERVRERGNSRGEPLGVPLSRHSRSNFCRVAALAQSLLYNPRREYFSPRQEEA